MSRPFEAKYHGSCAADCGRRIEPGDLAVFVEDETMHEDCAKDGDPPPRTEKAPCRSCFMVHAGECL